MCLKSDPSECTSKNFIEYPEQYWSSQGDSSTPQKNPGVLLEGEGLFADVTPLTTIVEEEVIEKDNAPEIVFVLFTVLFVLFFVGSCALVVVICKLPDMGKRPLFPRREKGN